MWNAVSRNGRSISARCSATATIRCRSCWIGGCGNTTYRPCSAGTLTYLHEAKGEVNQKQLERHLMVKPSTVNGIVDRLEEKGMVTRHRQPHRRRCRILALTAQGKQFYDRFIAIVHEVNDRLEKGFSPEEIRLLTSLLLRVAKNLSEEDEVC